VKPKGGGMSPNLASGAVQLTCCKIMSVSVSVDVFNNIIKICTLNFCNLPTCKHWLSKKTWNLLKFGPGLSVLQLANFYCLYNIVQHCTSLKKKSVGLLMQSVRTVL